MPTSLKKSAASIFQRMRARKIARDVIDAGRHSVISRAERALDVAEGTRTGFNLPQDAAAVREFQDAKQHLQRLSSGDTQAINAAADEIIAVRKALVQAAGNYLYDVGTALSRTVHNQNDCDQAQLSLQVLLPEYRSPRYAPRTIASETPGRNDEVFVLSPHGSVATFVPRGPGR